ncbi:MAG TPA: DUF4143 domain-containing protein [Sphaerochaeta sp.]|jgi:predicted AAA+ superfamily ATPase|nr:DUF4143 domain-containing protein [Sphaerochaeta sp.]
MAGLSTAEKEGRPPSIFKADIESLRARLSQSTTKDVHELYSLIFNGSMPRPFAKELDRSQFYMHYINTCLERDIQQLTNVGKLNEFSTFLAFCAARTAQEVNYGDILTTPTVRAWISILQRSGVITLLAPYYNTTSNRLIKRPKLYFMDTGLAAYLTRWQSAETLEAGAMDGAFLETYVVTEIMKSYAHGGRQPNLSYYREIDKNFDSLTRFGLEVQNGLIMCLCDELIPANRSNWYCPISLV